MRKILCSLLIVMLAAGCASGDEPVRLGIMSFTSKAYGVPDGMAAVIGDFFGSMLFKSKGIQLVERERLEEIGSEIRTGMSGLMSDSMAAKVGKLAGCQYMLLGSITNLAKGASGAALPGFGVPLLGGIAVSKEKVKAALDVRVIEVETGKIVFADGAEGEASKSETGVDIYGVDFVNSGFGGIENTAIAQAAAKLSPKIEEALTGEDTLTEILSAKPKKSKKSSTAKQRTRKKAEKQVSSQPVAESSSSSAAEASSAKPAFENKSTDPAKVIKSYGLSSGEANTLRVKHINASKLGSSKKAYDAYTKLAEENANDYLAAFKAGEIAAKLRKKDEARTWYTKALEINPDYEPAQKALAKL